MEAMNGVITSRVRTETSTMSVNGMPRVKL